MARILVVDDEPEVLLLLTDILESVGHEVVRRLMEQKALENFRRATWIL